VHYGTATEIRAHRETVLDAAHARNPERFSKRLRCVERWQDRGMLDR
jgi:hypothetical protein